MNLPTLGYSLCSDSNPFPSDCYYAIPNVRLKSQTPSVPCLVQPFACNQLFLFDLKTPCPSKSLNSKTILATMSGLRYQTYFCAKLHLLSLASLFKCPILLKVFF